MPNDCHMHTKHFWYNPWTGFFPLQEWHDHRLEPIKLLCVHNWYIQLYISWNSCVFSTHSSTVMSKDFLKDYAWPAEWPFTEVITSPPLNALIPSVVLIQCFKLQCRKSGAFPTTTCNLTLVLYLRITFLAWTRVRTEASTTSLGW